MVNAVLVADASYAHTHRLSGNRKETLILEALELMEA